MNGDIVLKKWNRWGRIGWVGKERMKDIKKVDNGEREIGYEVWKWEDCEMIKREKKIGMKEERIDEKKKIYVVRLMGMEIEGKKGGNSLMWKLSGGKIKGDDWRDEIMRCVGMFDRRVEIEEKLEKKMENGGEDKIVIEEEIMMWKRRRKEWLMGNLRKGKIKR